MATSHLVLEGLTKSYGSTTALAGLDLDVDRGELLTLLGPSGCGKTTALRLVAGFIAPSGGRILIDGADVTRTPPHRRDIGMVFQNYALFPHLTISDNIAFGLEERGLPKARIRTRVSELLDLVRLGESGNRLPAELSGGQQQRVALARAVAYEPRLLLMDEPLAALDLKLREAMQLEVRRIQRELGITTLYVTHDQTEAMRISDRIAILKAGSIEQLGTAATIYETPSSRFVADFIGRINLFDARVAEIEPHTVTLRSALGELRLPRPDGVAHGAQVTIGIRPDEVEIDPAPRDGMLVANGTVVECQFLGSVVEMRLRMEGGLALQVEAKPGLAGAAPGQDVRVGFPGSRWKVFPR